MASSSSSNSYNYNYNNPELSAVLKTLSTFTAPVANNAPTTTTTTIQSQSFTSDVNSHHLIPHGKDVDDDEDEEYEPSDVIHPAPAGSTQRHPPLPQSITTTTTPAQRNANANATTDPSTITTWPAALKHVMRAVSQNEALQARIRRLIRSQHEHERQWWKGREALIAKQRARGEKKRQLDEVLRAVGAPVVNPSTTAAASSKGGSVEEAENETELKLYDAKVYKASVDMARAMDSELRNLGIPFFAIRSSLVVTDEQKNNKKEEGRAGTDGSLGLSSAVGTAAERKEATSTTISRTELLTLQRRMLELLQDLCKD